MKGALRKMFPHLIAGALLTIILVSCKPATSTQALPTQSLTSVPSLEHPITSASPTYTVEHTSTIRPTLLSTIAPTVTPAHSFTPIPMPVIHDLPGPLYDTVVKIPIGENGIRYRGAGMTEIEITGPNGLAVLPDGSFAVGDLFDNRLLRYSAMGDRLESIDLSSLGILNVSDILATHNYLYVLEISFQIAPDRYRVNRLSFDGELIDYLDIPQGYHLEDGLIGFANGGGQVLLEFDAGLRYYQIAGPFTGFEGEVYGLPAYERLYQTHFESPCGGDPSITVGNTKFVSGKTLGGGLGMLAANPDGSFYAWRIDIVDDMPVMVSDQTIHLIDASGKQSGVARYPLAEWYFHLVKYLALGPDGNVYALITRKEAVEILRLNFYHQLDPISPEAAKPLITSSSFPPFAESRCDCSQVQRLSPESEEAQQIATEFLANFRQDWPAETMAIEQLWAIDRLGDYAILQSGITQETSAVIVLQRTERGYAMLAEYTLQHSDPRHSVIPDFFRIKLPALPPELLYCSDFSRFLGG